MKHILIFRRYSFWILGAAVFGFFLFFLLFRAFGASQVSLSLSPASGAYKVGDEIVLDILLDTGGNNVSGVTAFLSFDTEKLSFASFNSSNSVFDTAGSGGLTNTPNVLQVSRAASKAVSGDNLLVSKVKFNVKAVGSGIANVDFSTKDSYKSVVVKEGQISGSILETTTGGSYTINDSSTVTPPSNVKAANTTDMKAIEVRWNWDYKMPDGFKLARFYIYRSDKTDNSLATWIEGNKKDGNEYIFIDDGTGKKLEKGKIYYYEAMAIIKNTKDGDKESASNRSSPSNKVAFGSNEPTPEPVVGQATLYLDPWRSAANLVVGNNFDVNVKVKTYGNAVGSVTAFLDFDSSIMELVSASVGDFSVGFGWKLDGNIIKISGDALDEKTGIGSDGNDLLLAKLTFKLKKEGTGTVNFSLSDPNRSGVFLPRSSDQEEKKDILKTVNGGAYTAPITGEEKVPSQPSGFKADIKACSVALSWGYKNGGNEASYFRIGRSTDVKFEFDDSISTMFVPWISGQENYSYLDKGFEYNKSYYYKVSAFYENAFSGSSEAFLKDESGKSLGVTLKGPAPAPSAPSGLKAFGNDGNKTINLRWKATSENKPTNFEIWRIASLDNLGKKFPVDKYGKEIYQLIGDFPAGSLSDTEDKSGNGYYYSDSGDLKERLDTNFLYKYKVRGYIKSDSDCGADGKIPSAYSNEIAVPFVPKIKHAQYIYAAPNTDTDLTNPNDYINLVWESYAGTYFSAFEIFRKSGEKYPENFTYRDTNKNSSKYKDVKVDTGNVYFYVMRVCNGDSSACSAFSNEVNAVVADSPQNLRIDILNLDNEEATIGVSWDNTFPSIDNSERNIYLEEKSGDFLVKGCDIEWKPNDASSYEIFPSAASNVLRIPTSPNPKKIPLSKILTYRVRASFGGDVYTSCSVAKIDLSALKKFKGWGWANAGKDVDEDTGVETILGLGWVRLSKDTEEEKEDGTPNGKTDIEAPWYGIYADQNNTKNGAALLYGYAWGGNVCPEEKKDRFDLIKDDKEPGKMACGPGWLSFNPADLNYKTDMCPFPFEGKCEARVDFATGKISGWARFLAASSTITRPDLPLFTPGGWSGWLRLRSEEGSVKYGLCYGGIETDTDGTKYGTKCKGDGDKEPKDPKYENESVNGFAWGDAVIGWMGFGEARNSKETEESLSEECKPKVMISPSSARGIEVGTTKEFKISSEAVAHSCGVELTYLSVNTFDAKTGNYFNQAGGSIAGLGISDYSYIYSAPSSLESGVSGIEQSVQVNLSYSYSSGKKGGISGGEATVGVVPKGSGESPPSVSCNSVITIAPKGITVKPGEKTNFTITSELSGSSCLSIDAAFIQIFKYDKSSPSYFDLNVSGVKNFTKSYFYTAPALPQGKTKIEELVNASMAFTYNDAEYGKQIGMASDQATVSVDSGTTETIPDQCKPTLTISPISANLFLEQSQDFKIAVLPPAKSDCGTSFTGLSVETINPKGDSRQKEKGNAPYTSYTYKYQSPNSLSLGNKEKVKVVLNYKYKNLTGTVSEEAIISISEAGINFVGFSCYDLDSLQPRIEVTWRDDISASHTITLSRDGKTLLNKTVGKGTETFNDTLGIELGKPYYYKLNTSTGKEVKSSEISCNKASIEPTNVKVFSYNSGTLFVNWKDNDPRSGHTFKIERLRVRPAEPEKIAVKAVSENQVKLDWINKTTWTPYSTAVERARDSKFEQEKNSFSVQPISPTETSSKSFSHNDSGLVEATNYWYRLRACSQIAIDAKYLTEPKNTDNKVAKPNPVCSATSTEVSATTPPKAPSNLSQTDKTETTITLSWTDNSLGESGYRVYRNGSKVGGDQDPNKISYTDSGVSYSNSPYTYKVCAFKTTPDSGSVETCAPPLTASTKNPVVKYSLNVNVNPPSVGNSASVSGCESPDESGNCGSVSSEGNWTFISGATAGLTANPAPNYKFLNWGGKCSGTSPSCSFTMNNGYSVTANFELDPAAFLVPNIFRASIFDPAVKLANHGGARVEGGLGSAFQFIAAFIQKGEEILVSIFSPKGEAQSAPDYSNYFKEIKSGLTGSFLRDGSLEPDTVYLYRVKSCVGDADTGCSKWSQESAGKTLVSEENVTDAGFIDIVGNKRPICTRNIYCDYGFKGVLSQGVNFEGKEVAEESEYQCIVNNDCRGVGSSNQGYGER